MFVSINVARFAELAKLVFKKRSPFYCKKVSPMTKTHKHGPVKSFSLYIAENS